MKETIKYEFLGRTGYLLLDRQLTDSNVSLLLRAQKEIERRYPESKGQKVITKIIDTSGTTYPTAS